MAFCEWLSARGGRAYRLPTEAEWEHACRVGTLTTFNFGSQLNGLDANCEGTSPYGTSSKGPNLTRSMTVGSYQANDFGLYDMHGNVWEWCSDWYGEYAASLLEDPSGPAAGSERVRRGGGWYAGGASCRSALRGRCEIEHRHFDVGFRLASDAVDASSE